VNADAPIRTSDKEGSVSGLISRWLPLAAWVALIFGLSSIPGLSAEDVDLPRWFDKVVHAVEYAVLALLIYRGFGYGQSQPRWITVLIAVATGTGLAALDELYQRTVPGRFSSAFDFAADAVGVLAGTLLAVFRQRIRGERSEQR
jgi:VanZ family protein